MANTRIFVLLKIVSALLEHDKLGTGNVQFGSVQFNILLHHLQILQDKLRTGNVQFGSVQFNVLLHHLQIFPQGQETSNYIRIEPIRT